jgi:membrane-bound ClpP family serine protease
MVLLEGIDIGWLLIISGALLLLVEVYSPGFCYGPATVMIFLGILFLLGVDVFNSVWGVVFGVIIAICAAGFTVWMYGKITTNESPTTISRNSLIDMEGRVKTRVLGDIPKREAIDVILKEIQDAVPHVYEDELKDTS